MLPVNLIIFAWTVSAEISDDEFHLGSDPGPPYAIPDMHSFGLSTGSRRTESILSYALPDGSSLETESFKFSNSWEQSESELPSILNHQTASKHSEAEYDEQDYYSPRVQTNSYDYNDQAYDEYNDESLHRLDAQNDAESQVKIQQDAETKIGYQESYVIKPFVQFSGHDDDYFNTLPFAYPSSEGIESSLPSGNLQEYLKQAINQKETKANQSNLKKANHNENVHPPSDPHLPLDYSSFSFSKLPQSPHQNLSAYSDAISHPQSQFVEMDISQFESFSFPDIKGLEPSVKQIEESENESFNSHYFHNPSILQDPYEDTEFSSFVLPTTTSSTTISSQEEPMSSLDQESSIFLIFILIGLLILLLDHGYNYLTKPNIQVATGIEMMDKEETAKRIETMFQYIISNNVLNKANLL